MTKRMQIILIGVAAVALVGGGIVLGANWNKSSDDKPKIVGLEDNAEEYTGDKDTYQGGKNTATIDIPGFDAMNIKADTTQQSVHLYNPKENSCYFKMSIYLNDGTKLWESKLVEPSKAIHEITLSQPLSAGTYEDCLLKYECFAMNEDQTPLNGAETKFKLNVLE